jgi:hypothetical protein
MAEQHVGQIFKDVVGTSSYFVDPDLHHPELTLDEAASLLSADPLELKWAIEEDGICSSRDDQGKETSRGRGGRRV